MKTVLDTIQAGTGFLERKGVDDARHNMEWLIAKALGCTRMDLYVNFEQPLSEEQLVELRDLTKRRGAGEPLQHLLGTAEFIGREFLCDSRGLIPRPETEELLEHILNRFAEGEGGEGFRAADIGCGSGVIGLTLAIERPDWDITLIDLHEQALALTGENAVRHGLSERVRLTQGDLATPLDGTYQLIVANLPYIPSGEMQELDREVHHDPASALDGGADGTDLIRRLLADALPHLAPGGLLALEVGKGQTAALADFATQLGYAYADIELDLSENDRFLFAETSASDA